jgi:hypothetical protein
LYEARPFFTFCRIGLAFVVFDLRPSIVARRQVASLRKQPTSREI